MMSTPYSRLGRFIAVLVPVLTIGCAESHERASELDAAVAVVVTRVAVADVGETFDAGGIVQARTTATIASRILAPIRDVKVGPGDRVRAGQVLIVLDGSALAAAARSAKAAAVASDQAAIAATAEQRAAEATLILVRASHERIQSLHAKRSATAQEYDDATAALRAAEGRATAAAARVQSAASQTESARAASEGATETADFAAIAAPFDGVIAEKLVEPGNMAMPGAPLLRLEDTRAFRLDVRVDESRIGRLTVGDRVPVSLETAADESQTVDGTISEIARAADTDARAFLVKIALPGTTGVRAGTFGRARFTARTRRALQVPESALVRRGQVTSVFVVENGVARLRLVNVHGAEVLAGLLAGETVIVAPPPSLSDGRRVTTGGR